MIGKVGVDADGGGFSTEFRVENAPEGAASFQWDFDGRAGYDQTTAESHVDKNFTQDGIFLGPKVRILDGGGAELAVAESSFPVVGIDLTQLWAAVAGGTLEVVDEAGDPTGGNGIIGFAGVRAPIFPFWPNKQYVIAFGSFSFSGNAPVRNGGFLHFSRDTAITKSNPEDPENSASGQSMFGYWRTSTGQFKLGKIRWKFDDQSIFGFAGGGERDKVELTIPGAGTIRSEIDVGDALVLLPATELADTVVDIIDKVAGWIGDLSDLAYADEDGLSTEPFIGGDFLSDLASVFLQVGGKIPSLFESMIVGPEGFAEALDSLDASSGSVSLAIDNPSVTSDGATTNIAFDFDASIATAGDVGIPLLKGERITVPDVGIAASLSGPIAFSYNLSEFDFGIDSSQTALTLAASAGISEPQAGTLKIPPLTLNYDISSANLNICMPIVFGGDDGSDTSHMVGSCDNGDTNDVDIDMSFDSYVLDQQVISGACGLKIANLGAAFQTSDAGEPDPGAEDSGVDSDTQDEAASGAGAFGEVFNSDSGGCSLEANATGGFAAVLLELIQFEPQDLLQVADGVASAVNKATANSDFEIPISGKKLSDVLSFLDDFSGWVASQQDGHMSCGSTPGEEGETPTGGLTYNPNTGEAAELYCNIAAAVMPDTATILDATIDAEYGTILSTPDAAVSARIQNRSDADKAGLWDPFAGDTEREADAAVSAALREVSEIVTGRAAWEEYADTHIVVQPHFDDALAPAGVTPTDEEAAEIARYWRLWYAKGMRIDWQADELVENEEGPEDDTTETNSHSTTVRVQTFDELLQMAKDEGADLGFNYDEAQHTITLPLEIGTDPVEAEFGAESSTSFGDMLGMSDLDLKGDAEASVEVSAGAVEGQAALGIITLRDIEGVTRADGSTGEFFTDRFFLKFDPGKPLFKVSDGEIAAHFNASADFQLLEATAGPLQENDPVFRLAGGENTQSGDPLVELWANPSAVDADGIQLEHTATGEAATVSDAVLINDLFDADEEATAAMFPAKCSLGMNLGLKAEAEVEAMGVSAAKLEASASGYADNLFDEGTCTPNFDNVALDWDTKTIFGFDNLLILAIQAALTVALDQIEDALVSAGLDMADPVLGIELADAYKYVKTFKARLALLTDPGANAGLVACDKGANAPSPGAEPELLVLDEGDQIACRINKPEVPDGVAPPGYNWSEIEWSINGGDFTGTADGGETATFEVEDPDNFHVTFNGFIVGENLTADYPAVGEVSNMSSLIEALKFIFTLNNSEVLEFGLDDDNKLAFRFKLGVCTSDRIVDACNIYRPAPSLDLAFTQFKALETQQFPMVQIEANPALTASYALTGDLRGRVNLAAIGGGADDEESAVEISTQSNITLDAEVNGRPTFLAKIAAFEVQMGDDSTDTLKAGMRIRIRNDAFSDDPAALDNYVSLSEFVSGVDVEFGTPTPGGYECTLDVPLDTDFDGVDDSTADFAGQLCASLPVYFSGMNIGAVHFRIADFQAFFDTATTDVPEGTDAIDPGEDGAETEPPPGSLPDGPDGHPNVFFYIDKSAIDALLSQLTNLEFYDLIIKVLEIVEDFAERQDDKKVPLIGTRFSDVADFAGGMRETLEGLRPIVMTVFASADQDYEYITGCVENIIVDLLGPEEFTKDAAYDACYQWYFGLDYPGLNTIRKLDGTSYVPGDPAEKFVKFEMLCAKIADPDGTPVDCGISDGTVNQTYLGVRDINVEIKLGNDLWSVEAPPFDVGVDGLGLKTSGDYSVAVALDWTAHLIVGVNKEDGLYLEHPGPGNNLLELGATVEPPEELEARLAFLKAILTKNNGPGSLPSELSAQFDLGYPGDVAVGTKYYLQDLGALITNVDPGFSASAQLDYKIDTSLNADSGTAAEFPGIVTDLKLNFTDIEDGWDEGPGGNNDYVSYDNLQLRLGMWATRMLKPALGNLGDRLEPFMDPLFKKTNPGKGFLHKDIPIASALNTFLGGEPVTWKHFIEEGCNACGPVIELMSDGWEFISQFSNLTADESAYLDIGSFVMNGQALYEADGWIDAEKLSNYADMVENAASHQNPMSIDEISELALNGVDSGSPQDDFDDAGFSFPIWEKKVNIVYLLLGKDVDFVRYSTGWIKDDDAFSDSWGASIPLVNIMGATIYGDFGASLEIGFGGGITVGYDAHGLNQLVKNAGGWGNLLGSLSGESAKVMLSGFYVADRNANGQDVPEAYFGIGVGVYGGVSVSIGIGSIGGGITLTGGVGLEFDLANSQDTDGDGKFRFDEITNANFSCLIEIQPSLYVKLGWYAYLKIKFLFFTKKWTWNGTIAKWDKDIGQVLTLGNCNKSGFSRHVEDNGYPELGAGRRVLPGNRAAIEVPPLIVSPLWDNLPPVVEIDAPNPVMVQQVGDVAEIGLADTADPNDAISELTIDCAVDDDGDGSADGTIDYTRTNDEGDVSLDPFQCAYPASGQYTIRVTATDSYGGPDGPGITTVERAVYVLGVDLMYRTDPADPWKVWGAETAISLNHGDTLEVYIDGGSDNFFDYEAGIGTEDKDPSDGGFGVTLDPRPPTTGDRPIFYDLQRPTVTCQWRFGNGKFEWDAGCGSGPTPVTNEYADPGSYEFEVDLTPASKVGTLELPREIFVTGPPIPQIDDAAEYVNILNGKQLVTLNGANSYSIGVDSLHDPTGFCWKLDAYLNDEPPPPAGFNPTIHGTDDCDSTDETFEYYIGDLGHYETSLWVYNDIEWSASPATHTVRALAFGAEFSPADGAAPLDVAGFVAVLKGDAGDPILRCVYDWGDNTTSAVDYVDGNCDVAEHNYAEPGIYDAEVFVETTASLAASIVNPLESSLLSFPGEAATRVYSVGPPVARLSIAHANVPPNAEQAPTPALVDATASQSGLSRVENPLTPAWDLAGADATSPVDDNPLRVNGDFSAMSNNVMKLTLTDIYGSETAVSDWVRVGAFGFDTHAGGAAGPAPTGEDNYVGNVPQQVTLDATASTFTPLAADEVILSCTFDFGDGTTEKVTKPATGCGTVSHTYTKAGNFTITLTAITGTDRDDTETLGSVGDEFGNAAAAFAKMSGTFTNLSAIDMATGATFLGSSTLSDLADAIMSLAGAVTNMEAALGDLTANNFYEIADDMKVATGLIHGAAGLLAETGTAIPDVRPTEDDEKRFAYAQYVNDYLVANVFPPLAAAFNDIAAAYAKMAAAVDGADFATYNLGGAVQDLAGMIRTTLALSVPGGYVSAVGSTMHAVADAVTTIVAMFENSLTEPKMALSEAVSDLHTVANALDVLAPQLQVIQIPALAHAIATIGGIWTPVVSNTQISGVFSTTYPIRTGADPDAVVKVTHANLATGGVAILDASGSGDSDDGVTTFKWNEMDDLTYPAQSGAQISVPFDERGPDYRRFALTITDGDGKTTILKDIMVYKTWLVGDVEGYDARGMTAYGEQMAVTPQGDIPALAADNKLRCQVDWGDGTVTLDECGEAHAHAYADPGSDPPENTYSVTVGIGILDGRGAFTRVFELAPQQVIVTP